MFGATLGSRFDFWKLAEEDCPPRRLHAVDPDEYDDVEEDDDSDYDEDMDLDEEEGE